MELNKVLQDTCALVKARIPKFVSKFQDSNSVGGFYPSSENVEWTTGFCTGQYWLAYEATNDIAFCDAALIQVDSFLNRIEQQIDVDHHDMGFLYTPSCTAAYQLTNSKAGRKAALLAADHLVERFQEKGQFLQAWGMLGAPENYRLIIDCLLNLPLLYWASKETGHDIYRQKALAHTKTALNNLVRDDFSTYHTFYFNPATGAPSHGVTHQGYRDGSAWARGQAWGIYGLALARRYTDLPQTEQLFHKVAQFYLNHLPEDKIPYWDLDFVDGDEPRDSSAAAIAACGMLEMLPYLEQEKAAYYQTFVMQMTEQLIANYAVKEVNQSDGLLLHGVYAKSSPYNPVKNRGVDECNTWGDYFYLELLIRLTRNWKPYW